MLNHIPIIFNLQVSIFWIILSRFCDITWHNLNIFEHCECVALTKTTATPWRWFYMPWLHHCLKICRNNPPVRFAVQNKTYPTTKKVSYISVNFQLPFINWKKSMSALEALKVGRLGPVFHLLKRGPQIPEGKNQWFPGKYCDHKHPKTSSSYILYIYIYIWYISYILYLMYLSIISISCNLWWLFHVWLKTLMEPPCLHDLQRSKALWRNLAELNDARVGFLWKDIHLESGIHHLSRNER